MLPSRDELKERYASYPNHRLLLIIHNKQQYTAQAVEIARLELARRDLTTAEVDVFIDEQEKQQLTSKILSRISLSFWEKMLFFFFWFVPWFAGGAFQMNFGQDGFMLKMKQSTVFSLGGYIALLLDAFLTIHFRIPGAGSLALLGLFFAVFLWVEKQFEYSVTT